MRRIAELIRQLAHRLRGRRNDTDLDDEMRLHIELRAEQARAQGLDPDAAAASARRRFGNPTLLREQSQDAWGWAYLDGLLRDIRQAARTLRNSPGFAATAVLSLALGIGANTAVFSLIDALLLRELPVEDPRRLALVTADGSDDMYFTNPIWEQIRDNQEAFTGAFAFAYAKFDLAPKGEVEQVEGLWVSGDFFRTLRVAPLRGRLLTPEDDRRGCGPGGPVAVISERLWEARYGRDEDVLGRTILLDREPFRIVGVTPRWFTGLDSDRAYNVAVSLGCDPILHKDGSWLDMRGRWWLRVLGRLPAEGSFAAAEDHLRAISPGVFEATVPQSWDEKRRARFLERELSLRPAATGFSSVGDQYGRALYALLGIAGFVLLIACANVANLLLARSSERARELSMRMALGAGRARLVRRLLCESLMLALLGAAGGLAMALLGGRFLVRLIETQSRPILVDLTPDARVLGFATAAALLTVLVFGVAPALRATRVRLNDVLKEGARGTSQSAGRVWLGKAAVAVQVALSLVLMAAAALFLDTMRNLLNEDLGFEPNNVLVVHVDIGVAGVPADQRRPIFERLRDRLEAIPGVEAARAELSPMGGFGWGGNVKPEGYDPPTREDGVILLNAVSTDYFDVMRTPILMGRDFGPQDDVRPPKAIIVDEQSARRYWGDQNPIGKTIEWESPGMPSPMVLEVIGVVAPTKYQEVDEPPRSAGYLPIAQGPLQGPSTYYLVRSRGAVAGLAPAIREAAEEVSPGASLSFRDLETQVEDTMTEQRLVALLSLAFAALALGIAMVGLYGVTSYGAARRKGEIGVRIALGAEPASVVWLVLRDIAGTFAVGLALGWAGSLALGGLVEGFLFGVAAGDPRLIGLAALALAAAGACAAYFPARRASRLQPIAVLREE